MSSFFKLQRYDLFLEWQNNVSRVRENVINGRCRDRARQDAGMGLMNVKGKVWTADNGRPWGMGGWLWDNGMNGC